jgi:hypothetical protein
MFTRFHVTFYNEGRNSEERMLACTDKKEKKIFLIYKEIQRDRAQSHI